MGAERNGYAAAPLADEVFTPAEAAAFLKLPEEGVVREAAAGRLPGALTLGEWRFSKRALLGWLAAPGPAAPPPYVPPEWNAETEAECEAEIAAIYDARRAAGTIGDLQDRLGIEPQ